VKSVKSVEKSLTVLVFCNFCGCCDDLSPDFGFCAEFISCIVNISFDLHRGGLTFNRGT